MNIRRIAIALSSFTDMATSNRTNSFIGEALFGEGKPT